MVEWTIGTPPSLEEPGVPAFLYRLARANRTAVFGLTAGLVLVALFAPGLVGAVLLLATAAALFALGSLTWRVQPSAVRAARLAVLGGLVLLAVLKLSG
jgi:hypothetical protein